MNFTRMFAIKMGNLKIKFGGFDYEINNISQRRRLFDS